MNGMIQERKTEREDFQRQMHYLLSMPGNVPVATSAAMESSGTGEALSAGDSVAAQAASAAAAQSAAEDV